MASSESANPENEKITSTLTSSPLSLFGPNNFRAVAHDVPRFPDDSGNGHGFDLGRKNIRRLRSGDRRSLCLAWTREVLKPIRKICEYSPKRD